MKEREGTPKDAAELRRRAEERLKREGREAERLATEQDARRMVHELEVHQIELEMQNEELKEARKELEKQLLKYSDLYNFAPVGYFRLDSDGTIREANLTGARLLGIERSRLVGRRLGSFLHHESRPIFDGCLSGVYEETTRVTCELALSTPGDRPRYVQIEAAPEESDGNTVLQCRMAMIDITERRRAEAALREREERYRSLFENMLNGFAYCRMLFDENGPSDFIYLNVNAAFETLTGLKNVTGRKVSEVIPGIRQSDPELFEICGRVTLTGTPERFETYVEALGMWFSISVYSPEKGYFVAVFDVITERKRTEEILQKAYDQLELRVKERTVELQQAYEKLMEEAREKEQLEGQLRQSRKMEALGTLAGGIAHDFNNMLAAMIGFTELVKDRALKGSREEHYLQRVFEAGLRGRDLIKQMLAFSRKTELDKKPLHLSGVIRETMKLLRASIPATVSVRTDIGSEPGLIFADPTQMQQVLMNLCTNAAHAMRKTGGVLQVELSDFSVSESNENPHGIEPGPYMRLTVSDTGTGISPDIVDKIFDPFFTTKAAGEGTGLGLSVVHGIVKQHDGYITVASEPGKGSAFTVYLPELAGGPSTDTVSREHVPAGSERVLFVDDEEALAEMGGEMLEELGYRVTVKTSSSDALALFKSDPSKFDLVVTDQTMPEIAGVDLAREILAINARMPIIMCTGFSYVVSPEVAKEAGIRAFAMKPLTKGEFARIVRTVLDEADRSVSIESGE